jgi:UDP-N-acetylmuramoylalanine--D-glutamate ligase
LVFWTHIFCPVPLSVRRNIISLMNIAILGDGITAKAVRQKIKELKIKEVSLDEADLIITSPGISPSQFPKTTTEIISEIEFAYRLLKKTNPKIKIIGITGTNGKTTVTSLIAHMLDIPAAGNIGVPLISFVGNADISAIVVELSSYQLETCTTFKPDISILLNITPDHLERHQTIKEYTFQKSKIFVNQNKLDHLIYFEDDLNIQSIINNLSVNLHPYSLASPEFDKLINFKLIGAHNKLNAVACWKVAQLMNMEESKTLEKIASFEPVEHRIEHVLNYQDRIFYNDSKSTNPDSTMVAITSFDQPISLILGGKDKGLDLEAFLTFSFSNVDTVTVFGEIAERLYKTAKKLDPNANIYKVSNMNEAIDTAYINSKPGDVLLFSPACSSFDQFDNYIHRGLVFKEILIKRYSDANKQKITSN